MKPVLFCVWLICAVAVLNLALEMVSAANTIENIMGVILIMILVFGSIYSKCFTKFTNLWKEK